jgi:hypothetical protein
VKRSLSQKALSPCMVQGTVRPIRCPKPTKRRLPFTALDDGVDERCQRTSLRESDQHAEEHQ